MTHLPLTDEAAAIEFDDKYGGIRDTLASGILLGSSRKEPKEFAILKMNNSLILKLNCLKYIILYSYTLNTVDSMTTNPLVLCKLAMLAPKIL